MYARWGSFAVGLGLVLAPLVLGYGAVEPILHHVAVGLLVCIATLAALEWPPARFALALPALWLVWSARSTSDRSAAVVEIASGVLLVVLALFPSARFDRAAAEREHRAGARA
ncbi:hypothetical protein [Anaeromyxobacter oryzae]|uniref:SPW repeat-containing protein n=1 Tax=Anaeromyxobacter oryzae TaxID=2918170 RepID=A0ABM7WTB4_9BACT|nr:hypothetical protein [Anaeromyxobacter oryzae]BDG02739.1 hypothetical protein AMOR_17350 [Anaeromyxobacter oryzae]